MLRSFSVTPSLSYLRTTFSPHMLSQMPVIDQTPPSLKDRPSLKDDLPRPRRPTPEPSEPKPTQVPDKPREKAVNSKVLSEDGKSKSQPPLSKKIEVSKSECDNTEVNWL